MLGYSCLCNPKSAVVSDIQCNPEVLPIIVMLCRLHGLDINIHKNSSPAFDNRLSI